jgi:eukaryotic-like serine/threonine-protein kinase
LNPEAEADTHSVRIGESADYRYWAFISYSHADKAWGDWLHRALETYRVPKHLVDKVGAFGPVPRRLYPIFRDREELSVAPSLGAKIQGTLQESRSLIVICSPGSAASHWVNEEIRYFKGLNREDRILALIVAGEPNATEGKAGFPPDQECFPQALRYRLSANGELTGERIEIIAGDARKGKDDKLNAKLKLIAGLIGVEYDALKQRDQERRRRYLMGLTALACAVALAMTGLAIFALQADREAQKQAQAANTARDQADGLINFMLVDLRDKLQAIGHLNILGDVADKAKTYLDGLPQEQMNSSRRRQRALMLSNLGNFLQESGKLPEALDAYRQSLKVNQSLADLAPTDLNLRADLAKSYGKLGTALFDKGDLEGAMELYQRGLKINEGLLKQDPTKREWRYNLAVIYDGIGAILVAQDKLQDALGAHQAAAQLLRRLVEEDKSNTLWQRSLSVAFNRLGDIFFVQGNLQESLQAFQQGLTISKSLTEQDASNKQWQHDFSVSNERVGDVFKAEGKLAEALAAYETSLNIRQELVKQDTANAFWWRDLSISYNNVGDVLKAQGKLPEGLDAYKNALAICQKLVERDKSNGGWQSDLAWCYGKVGDVLMVQGKLPEAIDAFERGLAISQRLVEQDKTNADWRSDLAGSYQKVGDAALAQGKPMDALDNYKLSLDIRQRLADEDKTNTSSQSYLATNYEKIGDALKAQGKLDAVVAEYQSSLKIRRALVDQDKSNTDWQHDLIVTLQKLAAAEAMVQGGDHSLTAKALLQEAAKLAADYQGPGRQGMIDSINEASQTLAR